MGDSEEKYRSVPNLASIFPMLNDTGVFSLMPKFEYHTNLIKLIDFLNYDYNTLPKQLSLDATLCASRDSERPSMEVRKLSASETSCDSMRWISSRSAAARSS